MEVFTILGIIFVVILAMLGFGYIVTELIVDPTKSGVLMKGSLPPMYSGAFTYTSTTTSITISWNNLVIYRADGTTTNVGSGSQTITGLSAGETYNFLAYWNESTASNLIIVQLIQAFVGGN